MGLKEMWDGKIVEERNWDECSVDEVKGCFYWDEDKCLFVFYIDMLLYILVRVSRICKIDDWLVFFVFGKMLYI